MTAKNIVPISEALESEHEHAECHHDRDFFRGDIRFQEQLHDKKRLNTAILVSIRLIQCLSSQIVHLYFFTFC